ncbi:hypothetical protein Tco_1432233, partial [Tanacetum coccineum]
MINTSCMIVSCILLPLNKSESRERIMARKEIILLLLLPLHLPSVNQPPLITSMTIMMEMMKVPLVQAFLLPLERITKKRTKNEAKTTKPDSEWKSSKKKKSKSKPKPEKVNRKSTQVNPEAKSQD